jgi:hypothetical protein
MSIPTETLPAFADLVILTAELAKRGVTPATLTPGWGGMGSEGCTYVIGKGRWKKAFIVRYVDVPLVRTNANGEVRRFPF